MRRDPIQERMITRGLALSALASEVYAAELLLEDVLADLGAGRVARTPEDVTEALRILRGVRETYEAHRARESAAEAAGR